MPKRRAAAWATFACAAVAAVSARAGDVVVLDDGAFLATYAATPSASGPSRIVTVKGMARGDRIVAIDTRPADGALYGVSTSGLHRLDLDSGWATRVGPSVGPVGLYSYDGSLEFDPVADLARVFDPSAGPSNSIVALDPDTGLAAGDASLDRPPAVVYGAGETHAGEEPRSLALAYDVRTPGSTPALFAVDRDLGTLLRIALPDAATPEAPAVATTVGALGVPGPTRALGFEVTSAGAAYVVQQRLNDANPWLYSVDLATGAATRIRRLPDGYADHDLASAPTASSRPLAPLDVSRATIRLVFAKRRRGALEVRGALPASDAGGRRRSVRVSIAAGTLGDAQINRDFVLDAEGRGRAKRAVFMTSPRAGGPAKFALRISREDFPELLVDAGTFSGPLVVSVDLLVDGAAYRKVLDLAYAAKGGRGVAMGF